MADSQIQTFARNVAQLAKTGYSTDEFVRRCRVLTAKWINPLTVFVGGPLDGECFPVPRDAETWDHQTRQGDVVVYRRHSRHYMVADDPGSTT